MAKSKLKTKKSKKGGGGGRAPSGKGNVASGGGSGKRESKTAKPEVPESAMKPKEEKLGDKGESTKKKSAATTTSSGNNGGVAKPRKSSSKKRSSSASEDSSMSKSSKKRKKAEASSSSSSSDKPSTNGGGNKSKGSKKKGGDFKKPSAGTLALQKKWKETAEAMGGTKIVVNKAEAKTIIFDMLLDSFRPMNITEIHQELKGVVPSPVLKACLDEMTLDASGGDESDNDHDDPFALSSKKNKKKDDNSGDDAVASSGTYADSLLLKVGRNVNNSLYYVNQEKLTHDGNGLPPDERNELIGKEQKSAHERDSDAAMLRDVTAQTTQLRSEPINKDITETLAEGKKALSDLKERIEKSRQHEGNEKKRAKTKKRIQTLSDFWWKRRRLCKDFLDAMEDMTEGTVNAKKCLAGDGQIELESDETVIKDSLAAYESRKARGGFAAKGQGTSCLPSTATFVAVSMDGVGHVSRVYADDAE